MTVARHRKTPNFNYKPPRRHSWKWLVFLPIIIAAVIAIAGIATDMGHLHKPATTAPAAAPAIPSHSPTAHPPVSVKAPVVTHKVRTVQKYTVKVGDTLWSIAVSHLGGGLNWHKLYDVNQGIVGGNPNVLHPGEVLTL